MENKPLRSILFSCFILVVLVITLAAGMVIGYNGNWLLQKVNLPFLPATVSTTASSQSAELDKLFSPFWETWRYVHQNYVDQPVNDVNLMRGAIRGMLDSLGDPHTGYMDPDEYKQAEAPLEGGYEGIGAYVDVTGKFLTIISPMPGSPAEKAGLKSGDQVIAVDKEDMTGIAGELVLKKILGPAGTQVTLTIQRDGTDEPFDVAITRSKIDIPSVEGKMLDDNIAYIQLSTFGEKTDDEFRSILQPLLDKKPAGLILDLRYNSGGYLITAVDIISEFIPADKIALYEQSGKGDLRAYKTNGKGIATEIPLVVLVNEGSASASEITAGAVQDYKRGKLIGVTTYGKGSVQNWIPLSNDQGAVRITIARWLTPEKHQINKIGLKPDMVVELTEEDINNKHDSQLEAAVKLLLDK